MEIAVISFTGANRWALFLHIVP